MNTLNVSVYQQALNDIQELNELLVTSSHLTIEDLMAQLRGWDIEEHGNGEYSFVCNFKALTVIIYRGADGFYLSNYSIDVWDDETHESDESLSLETIQAKASVA